MTCRTGCPTKACPSYAACLKAMNLHIGDLGQGVKAETDTRLQAYADARRQGLQPASTKLADSRAILRAAGA